jgi:hypothetical protein
VRIVRRCHAPLTSRRAVPLAPRTAAARRCLVALGFIACLLAVGMGAAITASGSLVLPFLESCCLLPIGLVVIFELCPAVLALRVNRAAIRRLRRQLDALPETPHPLDQAARPRSNPADQP